jgi:hypothetical protein
MLSTGAPVITEPESYESFVNEEFPPALQALLPGALKRAYEQVAQLVADTSFLTTEGAQKTSGHLIQDSVDFQMIQLINSGKLPFDFIWDSHAKPTGKHLKLLPKNTVITISQLQQPKQFPRRAEFRNNQRLNNREPQMLLFKNDTQDSLDQTRGRPHLVLGHGYKDLNFASIYVPHSHQKHWNWRTPNLLEKMYDVSSDLPPVEQPDDKSEPTIKEEFLEWRREIYGNSNRN